MQQEGRSSEHDAIRGRIREAVRSRRCRLVTAHLLGLLLSVPILVTGIYLNSKKREYCITTLEKPLIFLGFILALVSMLGLIGTFKKLHWLHMTHMVSLVFLVLTLMCFAIFSVEITSGGSAHSPAQDTPSTSPYRFNEYKLPDYPKWMQRKVNNRHEWRGVTKCLQQSAFCGTRLPYNGSDPNVYNQSPLLPIQSGCCKPPTRCRFVYIDALHWIGAINPNVDPDCTTWNNDPQQLCYQCNSCRAGVIQMAKQRWKNVGSMLFITVIVLVLIYAIAGSLAPKQKLIKASDNAT
ncbi:hypothetical protein KP509_1Z104100 [Ceratopteris richardii]|nr:hypothetical protein KP509_1Z104100 [Ceratopteris richardii]